MSRRGPLITLGAVVVLAVIFLWANTLVPKPGATSTASTSTGTGTAARTPPASVVSHALYAGRSSGNEVTVAVAINGHKADAFLNPGLSSQVLLQGSVTGDRVTLTGRGGVGLTGTLSGPDMFGTVTGFLGRNLPFSAELTVVEAVYTGRSSGNEVGLAVVTEGDKAAAYVCDGKTVEAWLQGTVKGNQVTLTGKNGAGLSGTLSGLDMFGTVSPGSGQSFPFSAALSPHPAGVYQARITVNGLATRIGWAVLPDGTQLGVSVAGTSKTPAPTLNLSNFSFTEGGSSFNAAPVAGNATVVSP
jgi:hypothetical protein